MINFNLMDHYNTPEAANTFYNAVHGIANDHQDHTSLHLHGIISVILVRNVSQVSDISMNDVLMLNNNIRTENGTITNTESITADYRRALEDISKALSKAMHPDGTALGIVNANNEPVILNKSSYYGMDAESSQPKKPNIFKRMLNRIFGAFEEECNTYRQWETIFKRKEGINQEAFAANTAKQTELSERLSRQLSIDTGISSQSDSNQRLREHIEKRINELVNDRHDMYADTKTDLAQLYQEKLANIYAQHSNINKSEEKSSYLNPDMFADTKTDLAQLSQEELANINAQLSNINKSEEKSAYFKPDQLSDDIQRQQTSLTSLEQQEGIAVKNGVTPPVSTLEKPKQKEL